MNWIDWAMEWLKVSALWMTAYGVYRLCWVKYPPDTSERPDQPIGRRPRR